MKRKSSKISKMGTRLKLTDFNKRFMIQKKKNKNMVLKPLKQMRSTISAQKKSN